MDTESNHHYYGDSIRTLFIIGGLIMIVSYPFFSSIIKTPMNFIIVGAVTLAIFGGLMNPRQKWIMAINVIISVASFAIFEHAAIYTYLNLSPATEVNVAFFWINEILSLLFFFAAYLSTKTLRGALTTN